MTASPRQPKTERIEVRTTAATRALIDRAVEESATDRSTFVLESATREARRVLADRTSFQLDEDGQREWERINAEPARDLPGLRRLLARSTPFTEA